jgi:23S rRNA (cytidine2498-2'-O)-methyltransferase
MNDLTVLVLYCRAGFEKERAAELSTRLSAIVIYGYPSLEVGQAHVVFRCHSPATAVEAMQRLRFRDLIVARQWFAVLPLFEDLPASDRIAPILGSVSGLPAAQKPVWDTCRMR